MGSRFNVPQKDETLIKQQAPLNWTSSLQGMRLSSRGKASVSIPSSRAPLSVPLLLAFQTLSIRQKVGLTLVYPINNIMEKINQHITTKTKKKIPYT